MYDLQRKYSMTWCKISETTIFCLMLVRFRSDCKIWRPECKIFRQIFWPGMDSNPGREIWHKILWNTYKILEYVRSLTRIWQKIVVSEILDQVSQSDSWKIVHINKIFQESDSATWSKISETTILVRVFVGSYTII